MLLIIIIYFQTLRFISPDGHAAQDPQLVKVLNCDTISQAIEKILDTLYRNVPYSSNSQQWKDKLILGTKDHILSNVTCWDFLLFM